MFSPPTPYPPAPEDQLHECLYVVCCANSLETEYGSFLTRCCSCFGSSAQVYLEFSRIVENGSPQMVHRTELVKNNNTDHPHWHPFELTLKQLCEDDKSKKFLIECFQEHRPNPKLLGFACTTVAQVQSMEEQKRVVHLLDEHCHQSKGIVRFLTFQVRQQLLKDEASSIVTEQAKVLAEVPEQISSTKTHEIASYRSDVLVPMPITSSTRTNNSNNNVLPIHGGRGGDGARGEDGGHGGSVSSVQQHGVSVDGVSSVQQRGIGQNCVIVNGILYENDGTGCALTTGEREKPRRHNKKSKKAKNKTPTYPDVHVHLWM